MTSKQLFSRWEQEVKPAPPPPPPPKKSAPIRVLNTAKQYDEYKETYLDLLERANMTRGGARNVWHCDDCHDPVTQCVCENQEMIAARKEIFRYM